MRLRRLLLLFLLPVMSLAGFWFVVARTSDTPGTCLPSDIACLSDALDDAAERGFLAQMNVLSDSATLGSEDTAAICVEPGFSLGASSTAPVQDITTLLSAETAGLACRSAVLTGLLDRWSAATAAPEQRREDAGALIALCRDSTDPLCGEAVATGVSLVLPNDDAIRSCYRLTGEVRTVCLRTLMQQFLDRARADTDRDVSTDPREDLVTLCAYWPADGAPDDCPSAVGPAIFSAAFGSLGFRGPLDTTALLEALGFCDRLGPGALACQESGFRVPPAIGMVGAANSDRRTAYCAVFATSLRDECLRIEAAASGTPGPG